MDQDGREYAAVFIHRALGRMVRLTVADGYGFNLTFQEARTLARALTAVKEGRSSVDEVYLSPIGSDGDFHAKVRPDSSLKRGIRHWCWVGAKSVRLPGRLLLRRWTTQDRTD